MLIFNIFQNPAIAVGVVVAAVRIGFLSPASLPAGKKVNFQPSKTLLQLLQMSKKNEESKASKGFAVVTSSCNMPKLVTFLLQTCYNLLQTLLQNCYRNNTMKTIDL